MITIAGRRIGPGEPPYVIAEMSANHLGDKDRAYRIMDAAKAAGADALKLQTYRADTITLDADGPGFVIEGGPWDGRRLFELYEEAHTPWDWHAELFDYGRKIGITVFSSPFDETAVDLLEQLDAPAFKIASFELVDLPLIRRAARSGKPLIMSTGNANLGEIDEAVAAARQGGAGGVLLLHCVSGYPAPAEDFDLATIPHLAQTFGVPVGLSDHSMGHDVAVAAVALGAVMVEKHLTLARSDGGADAGFSMEPDEFAALTQGVRTAFLAKGQVDYGRAASEQANAMFRRSLYVAAPVSAGEIFTKHNLRSVRPGLGLPPKYLPDVLGKRAAVTIKAGTPLAWHHISG